MNLITLDECLFIAEDFILDEGMFEPEAPERTYENLTLYGRRIVGLICTLKWCRLAEPKEEKE